MMLGLKFEQRRRAWVRVRFKYQFRVAFPVPGRGTFLYVGDVFRPLRLSLKEVLEAWEGDRLALFELVRGEVEGMLGEVRDVRPLGAFLDPSSMTSVVEYVWSSPGAGSAT